MTVTFSSVVMCKNVATLKLFGSALRSRSNLLAIPKGYGRMLPNLRIWVSQCFVEGGRGGRTYTC